MEYGRIYHVYNRGNNKVPIFFQDRNYHHFMHLCLKYIGPYSNLLAYCLMPNHFHLVIKIVEEKDFPGLKDLESLSAFLSNQFRLYFMSYSKGINVQENRTGSLFQKNFKKIEIDSNDYLTTVVAYVHNNPVKAKLCTSFGSYEYSSYKSYINKKDNRYSIDVSFILALFGDIDKFQNFHHLYKNPEQVDERIELKM